MVPNIDDIAKRGAAALDPAAPATDSRPLDATLSKIVALNPHWLRQAECVNTGRRHGPAPSKSTTNGSEAAPLAYSSNWSGYEYNNIDFNHAYYQSASMNWTQIGAQYPPPANAMDDSVWAGIGSGNSVYDSLIQAGSESNSGPAFGGIGAYSGQEAFYELYSEENEQVVTNLTVNPGAQMLAHVDYDTVHNIATFTICADSNCVTEAQNLAAGEGTYGSQIEWIVERAKLNGTLNELQPFSTEPITNAGGQEMQGNGTTVDGFYAGSGFVPSAYLEPLTMRSCSGSTVLAETGSMDTHGDFTDYWRNTGVNESC